MRIVITDENDLHQIADLYKYTETFRLAIQVELFQHIGNEECTLKTISDKLTVDENVMLSILTLLVYMGLLEKKDDKYINTKISKKYLTDLYGMNLSPLYMYYSKSEYKSENIIKTFLKKPIAKQSENNELYMKAMENGNRFASYYIARRLKNYGITSLLDVGCGSGIYTIGLCKYIKSIEYAVCVDRSDILDITKRNIQSANIVDKVKFFNGDLMNLNIDGNFDCILFSNILHFFSEYEIETILRKYIKHLSSSGIFVIHDVFFNEDSITKVLFSLEWLSNGVNFITLDKLQGILNRCGMVEIDKFEVPHTDSSVFLAGRR